MTKLMAIRLMTTRVMRKPIKEPILSHRGGGETNPIARGEGGPPSLLPELSKARASPRILPTTSHSLMAPRTMPSLPRGSNLREGAKEDPNVEEGNLPKAGQSRTKHRTKPKIGNPRTGKPKTGKPRTGEPKRSLPKEYQLGTGPKDPT